MSPSNSRSRARGVLLRILTIGLALSATLLAPASSHAVDLPAGFEEVAIKSGFTGPVNAAWAPDGRIFVIEKRGVLKVVNPSGTVQTILDIQTKVNNYADRGLLGLEVDRDFASNRFLYLLYAYDTQPMQDADTQIVSRAVRIQVNPDNTLVNPANPETIILGSEIGGDGTCPLPANDVDCIAADANTHMLGNIQSDPMDGSLWISSGDGHPLLVTEELYRPYDERSLNGKILHVDRNGNGLSGHPFCPTDDDLTHNCTKVHAKGFRNPYRFTLRPGKGPAVGDVGYTDEEELDLVRRGENYGWPCYEGNIHTPAFASQPRCQEEYTKESTPDAAEPPAWSFPHNGGEAAIVGGPTYTGQTYPSEYAGDLFVGNYVAGWVKRLDVSGQDEVTGVHDFASGLAAPVHLEITPGGDLAYVSIWGAGAGIQRFAYAPGNGRAVARASATPTTGDPPLEVTFRGSDSTDPDGDPLTFDWDFGDGSPHSQVANPVHVYASEGLYTATLSVDDGTGRPSTDEVTIKVGDDTPPNATILDPEDESTFRAGEVLSLSGQGIDFEDGELSGSALQWHAVLHHGGHLHDLGSGSGATWSFQTQEDHDADSYYEITFTATDSLGQSDSQTIDVRPRTTQLSFRSVPAGAPMVYAGRSITAPTSFQAAVGFRAPVEAAATFEKNGVTYDFKSWSHGQPRFHEIVIPALATELVAIYEPRSGRYRDVVAGTAGLTGYWRLGEAAGSPTVASQNGAPPGTLSAGATLGRPSLLPADRNTAMSLNGTSGAVSIPARLVGPELSFEAWVAPSNLGASGHIVYASAGAGDGYGLETEVHLSQNQIGGVPHWVVSAIDADEGRQAQAPITTPAGQAVHLVMTLGADRRLRLFVNGEVAAASSQFAAQPDFSGFEQRTWIGKPSVASRFFPGTVDEVATFDEALDIETVRQHYELGMRPPQATYPETVIGTAGLTGYWRLGDAAGPTVANQTAGPAGTLSTGGALGAPSLIEDADTALRLNGTSGSVSIPARLVAPELSFEAWAAPDAVGATGHIVYASAGKGDGGGAEPEVHLSQQPVGGTPSWVAYLRTSATVNKQIQTPITTAPRERAHLVATFAADRRLRLYVNGALKATSSPTPAAPDFSTFEQRTWLGRPSAATRFFAGVVDEVATYSRALDAQTISTHYTRAGTPPPPPPPYRDVVLGTSGLNGYWRLGEASGTVVADLAGGHSGALAGGAVLGTPGVLTGDTNTALRLNGTSGSVSLPARLVAPQLSFEAWVAPASLGASGHVVYAGTGQGGDGFGAENEVHLSQHPVNGTPTWAAYVKTPAEGKQVQTAITTPVGQAVHLVATLAADRQLRLYVNGALKATSTAMAASPVFTAFEQRTWIGRPTAATRFFGGTVDEVATYATALSPAAVDAHYKAGRGLP